MRVIEGTLPHGPVSAMVNFTASSSRRYRFGP